MSKYLVMLGVSIGLLIGLGSFTFVYAKAGSYLTNDPSACANCHIMNEQFDGWIKSSHARVAACNDCHAPHSFFKKYMVKAANGFRHSLMFTVGGYQDNIQITATNREVTESACRSCHEEMVSMMNIGAADENVSCVRCHRSVGHLH